MSRLLRNVVVLLVLLSPFVAVAEEELGGTTMVVVEGLDPALVPWLSERSQALLVDSERGRAVAALEAAPLEVVLRTLERLGPRIVERSADGLGFLEQSHRLLGVRQNAPGVWGFAPFELRFAPLPPASASGALATVASDDFEGPLEASAGGLWRVSSGGSYVWGRTECAAQSGSFSADPVRGGSAGQELCCGCTYPNVSQSWLYLDQAVSVAGRTEPKLRFSWRGHLSGETDESGLPLDRLSVMVSAGGTWYGYYFAGDAPSWESVSRSLTSWYALGDLRQYPSFNVGFVFKASSYYPSGEGVQIDDFSISSSDSGDDTCGTIAGLTCSAGYYCRSTQETCFWMGSDLAGTCTPIPGSCPTVYDPVCGCDGSTYGNDCFAAMSGVSVWYEGECAQDDCTPAAPGNPRVRYGDDVWSCSGAVIELEGDRPALLWDQVGDATAYGLQVYQDATACSGTPWIDDEIEVGEFGDPTRPGVTFTTSLDGDYCWRVRAETAATAAAPAATSGWGCWTGCCCFTVGEDEDPWCGNGVCEDWESVWGCPADCGLGDRTTGRAGGATRSGYVPAAVGGQEGVGETYWLTEGFILNSSAAPAAVSLSFTPDDAPGTSMPAPILNLPPDGVLHFDNLVHELWGVRDNGCVWLDATVPVMFTTRTYNQTASGTYGQALGTVASRMTIAPGDRVFLLGASEDAAFRTNIVLQSVGEEAAEVRVIARRGSRVELARRTLTVPGHAKIQRRLLDLGLGGFSNGYIVVESLSGGRIAVLGSVVDNTTGDATTLDAVHAVQVGSRTTAAKAALQEQHYLVAVVAHKPGLNQTAWRSKLDLLNPLAATQAVRLEFHREGGGTFATTVNVATEEQVTFTDVIADLFPGAGDSGGSLHAFAPDGVIVSSRTYNQATGTFGQSIPGLAQGDLLAPAQTGVLLKLNNNPSFRCNMGFTEFSGTNTQVAVVVYAPSAVSKIPLGAKVYNVAAGENLHITRAFTDIGVTGDYTGAWAEVTVVSGGQVYAYASNVDEVTGDAEFIAAQRK